MASSKRDGLRTRNTQISYRNACGAPAPRTSLHSNTTKSSLGKKALKITNMESLFYTNNGDRLPPGVVSGVIFILSPLMNYLVVQ